MLSKKTSILVVDDTEITRELLSEALVDAEYQLEEAASGQAAIECVRKAEGEFDFIIMDQVMPGGMDGIEATRIIHKEYPQIRTIVMTIYGDGESSREALDAGAYRYVFRPLELEGAVDDIIALIESAQELAKIEENLSESYCMNQVFKLAGMALGVVDRTYRVLYANEAQNAIAGGESRTGGICWVEWHQATQQKEPCPWCPVKPLFEGEEPIVKTVPLVKQGRLKHWQTRASPIWDSKGQVIAALKWGLDVTEKEQAHQATLAAQDVEERLEAAVDQICKLGYSRARLYELSEDGTTFMGRKQAGGTNVPITEIRFSVEDDPYSQIWLSRRVPVIHRIGEHGDTLFDSEIDREGINEWLDVPLWTGDGQLMGKIFIDNKLLGPVRPDRPAISSPITDEHFESLLTIAGFAANAIRDTRKHEQAIREAELQRQLREIDADIAAVLGVEEVLDRIAQACMDLAGVSSITIRLQEGDKLIKVAGKGRYSELMPEELLTERDSHLPCVQAIVKRMPYIVGDAQQNEYVKLWKEGTKDKELRQILDSLGSFATFPLEFEEETIGGLVLLSEERDTFTEEVNAAINDLRPHAAIAVRNAKIVQEAGDQVKELQVLYQTSLDIAVHTRVDSLLQSIIQRAAELLKASSGALLLCDHDKRQVRVVVTHELDEVMGLTFSFGEGLSGRVAEMGKPVILNDYLSSPERSPQLDKEPYRNLFHALIGAPMIWQGEVIGVLDIADKTPARTFSVHDADLLESFASRAAIAIGNAELYEKTERQAKEMAALFEISQAFSKAQDSESILNLVVEHVKKLIDYDACAVYSLDRIAQVFRPVLAVGKYAEQVRAYPIEFGKGIISAVARAGKGEIVLQTQDDPRSVHVPGTPKEPQALLSVPLVVQGQVEGVVTLDRYEDRSFEENDARLLTTIVNQAATAIENLDLLGQLRRRAQQLSAISEIATRIQNTDEPQKMWHLALTGATADKGLGFSRAMLFLVDESEKVLQGTFAVGAISQDEALEAWEDAKGLSLKDYLDAANQHMVDAKKPLNELVQEIAIPLTPESSAPALCILENKVIHIPDAHNDLSDRQLVEVLGVEAFVTVPLIARKRAIGALVVDNKFLPHDIKRGDIEILETFANQMAVAVENAHLVRKQEQMFSDIAHQLYSPITSVRGFIGLLADGKVEDAETVQEYHEIIAGAVEYLGGMAGNLLNLRKIETGIFQVKPERVSVGELVQEAVKLYRYAAEIQGIDVQISLKHMNEWIEADKEKMTTAIQNLVENAIKYSPKGSSVVVSTYDDDRTIRIVVQDEGFGIPIDELSQIFDKRFRGRIAQEGRIDGTGIGLTIAQYVVRQHGGHISVQSELGQGSTFTIELPLCQDQAH